MSSLVGGAHILVEHTVAESYTGDGLIVASFDPADRDLTIVTSRCRVQDSLFGDPLWDLADALAPAPAPAPAPEAVSAPPSNGRFRRRRA